MKILINGEFRDASNEEIAERELTRSDAKAVENAAKARMEGLVNKFKDLGFTQDEIKALGLA